MDKKKFHLFYGVFLVAVGLGVFYRIPQIMPQVAAIEFFSQKQGVLKACFYLLGIFLITAGGIRIYKNYK